MFGTMKLSYHHWIKKCVDVTLDCEVGCVSQLLFRKLKSVTFGSSQLRIRWIYLHCFFQSGSAWMITTHFPLLHLWVRIHSWLFMTTFPGQKSSQLANEAQSLPVSVFQLTSKQLTCSQDHLRKYIYVSLGFAFSYTSVMCDMNKGFHSNGGFIKLLAKCSFFLRSQF